MATVVAQVPPTAQVSQGLIPRVQSTALYVGDLRLEVTEAILYEHFNNVGAVASVRVCVDAITRRSLGYAYVNFQSPADAERALDTFNFSPILGKPCRIMWCQRDPTVRRSGLSNIFIKGLDLSIDQKELYDAFSVFGNITSSKILIDLNGQSTGCGFVNFETIAEADKAIEGSNGTLLKDKKISVCKFKSKKDRLDEALRAEQTYKNVYVKNLPLELTDDQFKEMFASAGTVTSHIIMRGADGDAAKSKGFGFINFDTHEQAVAAVELYNNKEYQGKTLYAGRAMKKTERRNLLARETENRRKELQERTKGVNLYVKNLSENVEDLQFRGYFEEFGAISSARVMKDERGTSRGFGFVCFTEQADATRAVSEMNGRLIENKPLYVALAQSKDERRQTLTQLHRQRIQAQRAGGVQPYMGMGGMYPPQMMQGYPGGYGQQRAYGYPNRGGMGPQGSIRPYQGNPQGPYLNQGYPQQQRQQYRQNRPGQFQQRGPNPNGNNRSRQLAPNAAAGAPEGGVAPPSNLASLLAQSEPERQKQLLGDALYANIANFYPQEAGKLTGMLLQMDNTDLLHMIEDPVSLRAEADKAREVLLAQPAQPVA